MDKIGNSVQINERSLISTDLQKVSDLVTRFKLVQRNTAFNYLEMGEILTVLKNEVEHGDWMGYVNHDFHISQSTANSLMKMYSKWGNDPKKIEGLPLSIAMTLSTDNTPEDVTERVIESHKQGVTPKVRQVKEMKKKEKPTVAFFATVEFESESESTPYDNFETHDILDDEVALPETSQKMEKMVADGLPENQKMRTGLEKVEKIEGEGTIYILDILGNIYSRIQDLDNLETQGLIVSDEEKNQLRKLNEKIIAFTKKIKMIYEEPKKPVEHFDNKVWNIVDQLSKQVLKRNPGSKCQDGKVRVEWAKEVDKMIRLDKRDPEQIKKVLEWVDKHKGSKGFSWGNNILSPGKLREQWDTIYPQYKPVNPNRITVDDGRDWSKGHDGAGIR